jgi:8-amino-7-oxononanoate synthase
MGISQDYINHPNCLAIVYPLGKAVGLSGAFVVGSNLLKEFLVNFCRSFIYTTGPSKQLISQLKTQLKELSYTENKCIFQLKTTFLESVNSKFKILSGSNSAIVSLIVKEKAKLIEQELKNNKIFVKAIVSPTVASGTERLRICFHSYNSNDEVSELVKIINSFA